MMDEARPDSLAKKKFQFSLATLLLAMLYAGALATITVNLAGKKWNPAQITAAYLVTISFVVGFAVLSKARGRIAAYLLLSPLVFVSSVSAAAMFRTYELSTIQPPTPTALAPSTAATTTPVTTPTVTPILYNPPPPRSPGLEVR